MNKILSRCIDKMLGNFCHGHFGHGCFGLDISAKDISATETPKVDISAIAINFGFGMRACISEKSVLSREKFIQIKNNKINKQVKAVKINNHQLRKNPMENF